MARLDVEKLLERRKHTRLRVQNGLFAMLPSNSIILREVEDISQKGLRFKWFSEDVLPTQPFPLSLLTSEGYFVDTVAAKTVWTVDCPFESHCGVGFNRLTPEQSFRLKAFIDKLKDNPSPVAMMRDLQIMTSDHQLCLFDLRSYV